MAIPLEKNYKLEYARYRHYFHRIWKFYEKPATKVSTALLLTIFTTVFFAVFAIRPTLVTIAELLRQIEDQTEVLDQMKRKSAALATAQQEYTAAQRQLALLDVAIPPDFQLQDLLNMIEGAAAHHQLAIQSFTAGDLYYQPENQPSSPTAQTYPISVTMKTDYPNLKLFLNDLIRIQRLLTVETITFAPPTQASDNSGLVVLTVNAHAHYLPQIIDTALGQNNP